MWDGRIATIAEKGMGAIADATIPMWLSEDFRAANPVRTAQLHAMVSGTDPKGYVACCRGLKTLDYLKDAGKIANEVLCITGSKDMGAPPEVVEAIAAAIPGAGYVEIEGAHHVANVNKPEAFNAAVAKFLGIA